jgi:glycosyltransferase involved in cell wall biosynthesis
MSFTSTMKNLRKPIHVWVPGIREGSGGIQAFSRIYLQAIREAYPMIPLRVFVKNDKPSAEDPLRVMGIKFHSVSRVPPFLRNLAFALYGTFFAILERPCCEVTTHLHFLPILSLLQRVFGIPCTSILHGIEAWDIKSRSRIRALMSANHLTAVSEFTRQHVISQLNVDPERINVVPNTFDTTRFTPGDKPAYLMERYGFNPRQPVLMTVSRLSLSERYKGHRQVLMALPTIRLHFPEVRYLIVGEGDDAQGIRDVVTTLCLDGCVVMAGHIPESELPDHYRLCDLFVMPSSKEGFGIVFLEAMASGKPVVAGCIDGSVDALAGGRLSLLVDPNDRLQIIEAILKILRHEPQGALWLNPQSLSAAVRSEFGYSRVSRLMAEDLASVVKCEPLHKVSGSRIAKDEHRPPHVPKITVLCRVLSAERVEFFNAVSDNRGIHLEVIYLSDVERPALNSTDLIRHHHFFLVGEISMGHDIRRAIRTADVVIFADQISWFALQAMRERAHLRKAWVFWTDQFKVRSDGWLNGWLKELRLNSLLQHGAQIWLGDQMMENLLRKKYGGSRLYLSLRLPSRVVSAIPVQAANDESLLILDESVRRFCDATSDALARWQARTPLMASIWLS